MRTPTDKSVGGKKSPNLAQGVSDHRPPIQLHLKSNKTQTQHQFEVKIEQETNTTTVELKQRLCNCWCFCWIVVYCCCFLFNCCLLLKQSLTLGGLSGSPGTWPSPVVSLFGGTFFQLVFLHSFFRQKNTFVANWTPKMTPKSIPNLALDLYFLILCTRCFCCPAQCF